MDLVIDLTGPVPTSYAATCCDVCARSGELYRLVRTTEVLCAACFAAVHATA